jgi:hypothetical protein
MKLMHLMLPKSSSASCGRSGQPAGSKQ